MDNFAPEAAGEVNPRWRVPLAEAVEFSFGKAAPFASAFPAPLPPPVPEAPVAAPVLSSVINSTTRSWLNSKARPESTEVTDQDGVEGGVAQFLIGASLAGGIKRKGGPGFFHDSIDSAEAQEKPQIPPPPPPQPTTEVPVGQKRASTSGAAEQPAPKPTHSAAPRTQTNSNQHQASLSRNTSPILKSRVGSSSLAATAATKPRASMHPRQEKQRRAEFQPQQSRNEVVQGVETDGEAEARVKRRKVDVDEIIAGVTGIQSRLDAKTHEIKALTALLAESKSQITKLTSEKESLKSKFGAKLRASLAALAVQKDELDATISSMRDTLVENRRTYGDGPTSEAMQQELAMIKELLGTRYFSEEGALWLERHEESKLVILRDLQHELGKHAAVIAHLRDQLATKTGETAEARDRISTLERARDAAQDRLSSERNEWAETNGVMKGEIAALRKAEDERMLGVASNQELEKTLKELETKWRELEKAKEESGRQLAAAEHAFERFRQRTVAEQDLAAQDLKRKTDDLASLAKELETALSELVPLRLLPAQLASTQLELNLTLTKLADATARANDASTHHSALMDGLQIAFASACLERDGKTTRLAELQADLDALVVEKLDLVQTESTLRASLSGSQTALEALESKTSTAHQSLIKQNVNLATALQSSRAETIARERETAALEARFSALELKCTALESKNSELTAAHRSVEGLSDQLESLESVLAVSEEEIVKLRAEIEDRDSAVKEAAAKTERACNAAAAVELASVKNDLKKMKGLYDEKAQALGRALGELAKARGRPGIDQSSSLDGDEDTLVAAPHPTPAPIDAGARENSPPPAAPAPHQNPPAEDPRQFILTHNPDAAPKPKKKTLVVPPAHAPAPAAEADGKKKATRRGRSTGRAAKDRDASDEIEDDDEISVQMRPATKTYAKRKKA